MRRALRIFCALLFTSTLFTIPLSAQQKVFSQGTPNARFTTSAPRVITPEKYYGSTLDNASVKQFLWSLPKEGTVNRGIAPMMELPMPDGSNARFRVWESSIMQPGLQAKFSEIRTYVGQGIDDPTATLRMDYNPYFGFHAQIISTKGTIYIDPYARGDIRNYMSYYHRDNKRNSTFTCEVPEFSEIPEVSAREDAACRGTELYTYRLAVANTGEYAQAVGASTPAQLHAAIVTTVNRVNGVYETELAIRLILIDNNDLIEFLNPLTDPFDGNFNGGTLINESQAEINGRIGTANYDIGHTFSTGGGGLAGLGVVCRAGQKARGITGSPNPVGDGYDIDYVAHEIGHQFGGSHTFNSVTSSCNGNRSSGQAYEVGSGTTIMAYAGICASDNTQPNSDPYFHAISFDQISTYIETGNASCRILIPNGNNLPVITSMENNNVSIPLGTPFTLTGSATDADGDALTYSWEQWDLGGAGAWNSGATSLTAPLFRSRVPKTSGSRTFPDIRIILAGYPANPASAMDGLKGETLPTVARDMKFRMTVRDNRAGGGGVVSGGSGCATGGFTGVFQISTVAGTGPFVVSSPNGGESYPGGSVQTVSWSVAGTDAAPISCTNVKITMSTDGGFTYPYVVLASTANDGTEQVTIPAQVTTTARMRVEAVGNVFFDISNANFTITAPVSGFEFVAPPQTAVVCAGPASASVTLQTSAFSGFATPITLSATGNPAGTTVSFGTNPLAPGSSTLVTLNNTNTLANGLYTFTVSGTAGPITTSTQVSFNVALGVGPAITTQPQSVAACVGTSPAFTVVAPAALAYQWQVSTNGGTSFTNVASGGNAATYTVNNITTALQNNQYRVRITGQCNVTTSAAATLTVQTAPAISQQPQSVTLCLGTNTSFLVDANGTNLTYQWQLSTAGGAFTNIPGANASSYAINNITVAQSGNQYRVVIGGTCAPALTSTAGTLTVISPVTVTTDPEPFTICETGNASFSVVGNGTNILYQWQVSTNGGTSYTDIAGATSSSLELNSVTSSLNNNLYRALVYNNTCTAPDASVGALLTVNARPTVALAASPLTSILPGQSTTITATIQPAPTGFDISWFKNNTVLPGVIGTSYLVDSVEIGDYKVRIVNQVTGCNNESPVLTITTAASSRLFIFPNPNNGQFTISYYNSAGTATRQMISIYDAKGALVYQEQVPITGPYTLNNVDLRSSGRGVYFVVVADASGKRIVDSKILVQ